MSDAIADRYAQLLAAGDQNGAVALLAAVDVFLRPAAVLETVYAAMTAAWPR